MTGLVDVVLRKLTDARARSTWKAWPVPRLQQLVPGIIGFAPATDYEYLREIQRFGASESRPGLVNSIRTLYATLDTDEFFGLDDDGHSREASELISATARTLCSGGADFLVVTSNSGSIILEEATDVALPVLSIFETATREATHQGFHRLGLLSTRRTAESGRYQRAAERLGAHILTPPPALIADIDAMIDAEAIRGISTPESLALLREAVEYLAGEGADCAVLGCTDLVLFGPSNVGAGILPIVDSTRAHARAAAARAVDGWSSDELDTGHAHY
ncbi:aspartate/glutamate racemase family protein [Humibacter antri]